MKDDWRDHQLPPPEGTEDRADGFISVAILAFAIVAPLIYFGPQLGAIEDWIIDVYRVVDGWIAPLRGSVFGQA